MMIELGQFQPVNEQKIEEALAIYRSVSFLEREIYTQMTLLQEAVNNDFFEDIAIINKRINHLCREFERECEIAEGFKAKYGRKSHEEKAVLSGVK